MACCTGMESRLSGDVCVGVVRSLTLVKLLGGCVVGAALDNVLHVLWLDVDGHCADDRTRRRRSLGLEADWTGRGHAHIQLLQLL
jgi:hypothetical protein